MMDFTLIIVLCGCLLLCTPAAAVFTSDGCGSTKGCFQLPGGCSPSSASCVFFSWFWNATESKFFMELSGKSGNGATYAAIAFGQQSAMADADLYYCTGNALGTGAIQQAERAPAQMTLSSFPGVAVTSAATADGVAQCTFTRTASITKEISGGNNMAFDLTAQTFYLLLADGAFSGGSIGYHQSNRVLSSSKVNMTQFSGAGAAGKDILDKVHGGLMILAWLVLANMGVVIARHFKPLYPNSKPCGEKAWFQAHRTIMITTLVATATAFIIIFVEVDGYDATIGAHAIIGIVVMVLTLLNPTIALFRCHPGTPKRPIFNFVHTFIGFSARTLGIANMFLGVELAALGLPVWTTYVLGGFVGFLALCEILFEVLSWMYGHICYGKQKKDDSPKPDGAMDIQEPDVRVRGQGVKTALLVVYIIGNIGFALSLWIAIGNA